MSLLRAAALLGRAGLVSGPALPAQLGALTALQHKLTGCLIHQQPAAWLQARGLSAPSGGSGCGSGSGGSGSGGSGPDQQAASQQEQGAAAAAATGDNKSDAKQEAEEGAGAPQADAPPQPSAAQQVAQQAEQAEPSGKESAAAEAAGEAGNHQPSSQSFEQDPRLAKFVEGLKQLKGSSTVQRQTVGGDSPWWLTLVSNWVGPIVQNWISDWVKAKIEQQFDTEEFLEGAADAFTVVNELLAEGDWEALRPMMSAKMYNALKSTDDAYRGDGLVWRTELIGAPKVGLRGVGFMFKDQMAQYDEEIAKLGADKYKCEQNTVITRAEDGQVVAELKDLRPQRWKFATGPLPPGLPVSRLETEWFLLTI
ncbi:hypothetical protein COHA_010036 [Chlorella ohadii]|uniref:Tim44-like domain-containing protein n=1 Tax=Chlorella ohadii TaxID=2649997 RepID=A0AAD5DEF8_9CHLO|nr:hypothetical protein COHA_010036 [Chlorella ohadii]